MATVQMLLAAGADINRVDTVSGDGENGHCIEKRLFWHESLLTAIVSVSRMLRFARSVAADYSFYIVCCSSSTLRMQVPFPERTVIMPPFNATNAGVTL
jgi:hypothetical protein